MGVIASFQSFWLDAQDKVIYLNWGEEYKVDVIVTVIITISALVRANLKLLCLLLLLLKQGC